MYIKYLLSIIPQTNDRIELIRLLVLNALYLTMKCFSSAKHGI